MFYPEPFDDVVCAIAQEMIDSSTCSTSLHGHGHREFWFQVCKNLNEGRHWNEKRWTEEQLHKLVSRRRRKLFQKLEPVLMAEDPELWKGQPSYFRLIA